MRERWSLNPYSIGIYSLRTISSMEKETKIGLNPYSIGIYSLSVSVSFVTAKRRDGLNPYSIGIGKHQVFTSLVASRSCNPCYNGIGKHH